jgi:ABC-type ATPase involved in cell division
MKIIEKLERKTTPLTCTVIHDDYIRASEKAFDCAFDGTSTFYPWEKPQDLPKEYNIGVIYGTSGSGKSTLLKEFGTVNVPDWGVSISIISHFDSPDEGINKLSAVGLNTIPNWYKPYHVLSNGERFRADLSRSIYDGAVIDEFSSVVDRNVAKASSVALSKYIRRNGIKNVVISTCHEDVLDWLEPDWVINTNNGEVYNGNFIKGQISISKYIEQTTISGQCLRTITI